MFFIPFILVIVVLLIYFLKSKSNYWQRKGMVFEKPTLSLGKNSVADITLRRYKKFKSLNVPHGGGFTLLTPTYIPLNLALIKKMLTTDFSYFLSHGIFYHPGDILSMHLFNLDGDFWKSLRMKLTPTFTTGKMKMMFDTLLEKANILDKVMMRYVDSGEPANIKDVLARFTTDIIGSCAFGIECNSMENPDNEFRKYGVKIFKVNFYKFALTAALPKKLLVALNFQMTNKDVTKFFSEVVKDTIRTREENKIFRKDFMQLLLELKQQSPIARNTLNLLKNQNNHISHNLLSDNEIIAQCFVFFLAGFETSSTTMTFCLFELAQNSLIQERVREEIKELLEKNYGKISYNEIMHNMPYLDKVVNETLRMYPPVPTLPRKCTKTYKVSDTEVTIEKGTRVQIPIIGIHRDPEYYANPEVFDPEHFNPENIAKRPDFSFMPFGAGPRICIGMRFGLLQTKLGLVSLLKKYQFSLNGRTVLPMQFEPSSFIISVKGDVWIDVIKIID